MRSVDISCAHDGRIRVELGLGRVVGEDVAPRRVLAARRREVVHHRRVVADDREEVLQQPVQRVEVGDCHAGVVVGDSAAAGLVEIVLAAKEAGATAPDWS